MTVSDQIIAVIDSLCAKFGIAIDWTQENVLPYVMELAKKFINYEIATSIALIAVFLVLFVTFGLIAKYFGKKAKEVEWDEYDGATVFAIISIVIFVVMTLVFICVTGKQIFDIITCVTFPEKIIFEYIKQLTAGA